MQLYKVTSDETLTPITAVDPATVGLKETANLEAWVLSLHGAFERPKLFWLSRQERTSDVDRADLIGLAEDELLVVELKRGLVGKEAIAQGLAYLSRHAKSDRVALTSLFVEQAKRTGKWALRKSPLDENAATNYFLSELPADIVLNQWRTLVLVGTEFEPETLQICNFLNESFGVEGTLSVECWKMGVFQNESTYLCAFDKLLPTRDVEEEIQSRREERRTGRKRDPERVAWMQRFKEAARKLGYEFTSSRGESYGCRWTAAAGQVCELNTAS